MSETPAPTDAQVIERHGRRYRAARSLARLLDRVLGLFFHSGSPAIVRPRRILLANYGHLGDVVMSTAALGVLKSTWPDVDIGFLIGSWSRAVLANHPDVARIHVVDHWFMDRRPINRVLKGIRYWADCGRVAREIREVGYDIAVDLRAYRPNAIPVLWLARVPIRIGYTSVGFGPLLTHPRTFVFQRRHETEIQTDLLRLLPIPESSFESPPFRMAPSSGESISEVRALLGGGGWSSGPYCVIHMGASVPVRDWPIKRWRELVERLVADGRRLVFTGRGTRDRALISQVMADLSNCLSACDRLSFGGLVELIRGADLVISVETVAGHIAAAVGTPCVAIYGGMSDARQWAPKPGPKVSVVSHVVPCWPCFQYNGCEAMSCLRDLPVSKVIHEVESLS